MPSCLIIKFERALHASVEGYLELWLATAQDLVRAGSDQILVLFNI